MLLVQALVASSFIAAVGGTNVPKELPRGIKQWEEVTSGRVLPPQKLVLANAVVEYDFYVSPERPRRYSISHFRVRPTKATGVFAGWARGYRSQEVVVWFDDKGESANPRVFVRRGFFRHRWHEVRVNSWKWVRETGIIARLWSVDALIHGHGYVPQNIVF